MLNLPFNVILIYDSYSNVIDYSGKRVIVNSIGGSSWPDNKWVRGIENLYGTIVWGPVKLYYNAQAKIKGARVKPGKKAPLKLQRFETDPYFSVKLDKLNRELRFISQELTFIDY